ncbi:Plexin-B3 [Dissostichus eleginoides]|uniref:Plexin-B3 n=1 Tax=Dissostichus eleginoides TaxID=100907 RepID=A0AAD9CCQ8_DISEL|nr:Plexin-B3 [Dissostichus eleginoides]
MKGTLQKFVDDVFVAILSTKRPPPIAVRFFFDFLDDMAEKHGIDDPETVTDSIDAVLSVIAQTFIDSCTTSEHKVGRDSPVNKLLYAREIPRYKQLVESDIHSSASGCYQEMNSTLTELSGQSFASEMNTLVALHELYKYINKYYDQGTPWTLWYRVLPGLCGTGYFLDSGTVNFLDSGAGTSGLCGTGYFLDSVVQGTSRTLWYRVLPGLWYSELPGLWCRVLPGLCGTGYYLDSGTVNFLDSGAGYFLDSVVQGTSWTLVQGTSWTLWYRVLPGLFGIGYSLDSLVQGTSWMLSV